MIILENSIFYIQKIELININDLCNLKTLKFSTGLKVRFTGIVTPSTQANIDYIVADVGTSIRLIPLSELYTPESAVYTLSKDYLTIKRGAIDGNQWSNNNRWFHEEIITATATYNVSTAVYDSTLRAKRPIIEFDNDFKNITIKIFKTSLFLDSTVNENFNSAIKTTERMCFFPPPEFWLQNLNE